MSFHNYGVLIKVISGWPCFGAADYTLSLALSLTLHRIAGCVNNSCV